MKKRLNVNERSGRHKGMSGLARAATAVVAVLTALLITLTAATLADSARARAREVGAGSGARDGGRTAETQDIQQAESGQLTVTFNGQGVTPSSVTVGAGIIHLTVENQSGQEQLTLRVRRQSGEVVREIIVQGKILHTELPLEAGQYVLVEVSHTGWACQLTVQ